MDRQKVIEMLTVVLQRSSRFPMKAFFAVDGEPRESRLRLPIVCKNLLPGTTQ